MSSIVSMSSIGKPSKPPQICAAALGYQCQSVFICGSVFFGGAFGAVTLSALTRVSQWRSYR
jgi:hypothetical protein